MMSSEGHIGIAGGIMLVYAMLSAKLFMQLPTFIVQSAGPAAWQVAVIATACGILFFLPTMALAYRFPGRDLSEISEDVAGSFLGTLLTLLIFLWLFFSVTIGLRSFTETFISTLLPDTPPSVLTITLILCAAYTSYRGLEPLARTSQVLFALIALGTIFVLLFSLPRMDMGRLYPFWGYGLMQSLISGAYLTFGSDVVVLVVLGYSFRSGRVVARSGLTGILLSGLAITATVAVLIGVFGAPDAAQQPFPVYTLARLIYLGRFLQRTEAILVVFWFFALTVRLTVLFHATVVSFRGMLRLPYYRPLIPPIAVLVVALTLLPESFINVMDLEQYWTKPFGLGALAIPLLLLLLALVRKKGGQAHAT